jgi:parvulin-like peptidyl-prolyl isomerase
MKRSLFAACLATFAITASAQEVLDGIAAVVGVEGKTEVITFSQVRELIGPVELAARRELRGEELNNKIKEIRLRAINDLIDRQIIILEFKKNKFSIPPHYVEDRVQTIIRSEFGGDRSAFVRTLQAQGFTLDRFREIETEKMIVQAMRSSNVKGEFIVPENKIAEYYQNNRSAYTEDDMIKLRLIAIRKAEDGSESRRGMIEEIRQKIVEGAEFQDLARMYSEDSTQDLGGDWGWIDRKTLNDSLSKIAFNLKPGMVSEIIDLSNSYYLLFVEAKKNGAVKPLSAVRDEIQAKLAQQERQKRADEWIARLRKKAYVKIF